VTSLAANPLSLIYLGKTLHITLCTQKLPTICEEMIKYASNPKGVTPVVLIKLQNALKSTQPSSVEPERCFSTCGFYVTKLNLSLKH
jgi:hypothetical protein